MNPRESLQLLVPESIIKHGRVTSAGDILLKNTGGSFDAHWQLIQIKEKEMGGSIKGDFVPIYQFEPSERQLMGQVWKACFGGKEDGVDGYMNHLPAAELRRSKRLVSTAMGLVFKEFLGDKRDSGDPTSSHSAEAVLRYATKYKPSAQVLAGLFCHDLIEDKKMRISDIRYLFGERDGKDVADYVKALTKVRKFHKEAQNRTETVMKLLRAFRQSPSVIIGKVIDAWQNSKTLYGKTDPADRLTIATYYLQVYYQLAKIGGVYDEADEIADYCYAAIDEINNGPEFVGSIKQGIKDYLEPVDIKNAEELVKNAHKPGILSDVKVRRPGVFALVEKLKGRRELREKDFYLDLDIAIHDLGEDETKFARRANKFIFDILYSSVNEANRFEFPEVERIGFKEAYKKAKEEDVPYYEFKLDYIQDEKRIPISVKVYRKSEYDLVQTPLTYLDAVSLSAKDSEKYGQFDRETLAWRKKMAQDKLERINRNFRRLRRLYGDDEPFVNNFLTTLPDAITVVSLRQKKKGERELRRRPIPRGATVLDYAIITEPLRFQELKAVEVNGKPVDDYRTELKEGDAVRLKFGRNLEGFVEANWFDAIQVNIDKHRGLIADKLIEKLSILEYIEHHDEGKIRRKSAKEEKERLGRTIRHRGWLIINSQVGGNLSAYGLDRGRRAFPNKKLDPRTVAFQIGIGQIGPEVNREIARECLGFFTNLPVLVVEVPNRIGELHLISGIFSSHDLDIVSSTTTTKYGSPYTYRLEFRFDIKDLNDPKLREALAQLDSIKREYAKENPKAEDKYEIHVFDNHFKYQKWLEEVF